MAKIPYPEIGEANAALVAEISAQRGGQLLNLYRMLLHSPPLAHGWLQLLSAIRAQCGLAARLREMVILRVALLNGAGYEYAHHLPLAIGAGLTEAQCAALGDWSAHADFSPVDRAVLAYTDAMTRDIQVPDAVFTGVREQFSDAELVELTVTISGYNMVSRLLEALAIERE